MMDKNDIRKMTKITTPSRGGFMDVPEALSKLSIRKVSLEKVSKLDITYKKMAEIAGVSEYEVRRYLGLIQ